MGDLLQFVDAVSATPTVRLDLNDDITWGLDYEGTDLSPPDLKEVWSGTPLADGERLTAAAFTNRTLRLSLDLMTSTVDNQGVQLQRLWRELNRPPMEPGGPNNLIRWHPTGMSKPVFFRTFRSSRNRIKDMPGAGTYRRLAVDIEAESCAVGLKETVGTVTVYNDPAEGTTLNSNPFFEVDAAGWFANAGEGTLVRSTAQFHEGTASLLLTPDGVGTQAAARSVASTGISPGEVLRASAWMRCAVARTVSLRIDWRDAAGVFMSTTTTPLSLAANTWTFCEVVGTAPASTAQAGLTMLMTGTPPASNTLHVDEARLRRVGGVGGMCLDITGVIGDVEAPLYVQVRASDVSSGVAGPSPDSNRRRTALAMRRRGTPNVMVVQAESMTPGNDATLQSVSDASRGQVIRVSFVSGFTNLLSRGIIDPFPATVAVDTRGQYRAFVRVKKSVSTDVIQMRLSYSADAASVASDAATLPPDTVWHWIDMGVVQWPLGYDPQADGSGVPLSVSGMLVNVLASRGTGGSGNLDIDSIVWLPADDRMQLAKWPNWGTQAAYVIDPMSNQAYALGAAGELRGTLTELVGRPLMVSPGQTNRLWVMRDVGTGYETGDDITGQVQVTAWYYPQYLYVRPQTS